MRQWKLSWRTTIPAIVCFVAVLAVIGAFMAYHVDSTGKPDIPATSRKSAVKVGESADGKDTYAELRRKMVEEQLRGRDIRDTGVLEAMSRIPRERFVPEEMRERAYEDCPLPIGLEQTISQPYIVALMTQLVHPSPKCRALDVGSGSGYQAAVLAELCSEVYGIEILKPLADAAGERLAALGYRNVTIRSGDGYGGWPEKAPFDIIILAAAPDHVPQALVDQLAPGGRLVLPVKSEGQEQELVLIEKKSDGSIERKNITAVRFVPMTGAAQKK